MQSHWKQRTAVMILAVACVACAAVPGRAQETPTPSEPVQKLLAPVESMINKNLYAFGYVNVKAINIDTMAKNWKELVTLTFESVKADEVMAKLAEDDLDLDEVLAAYMQSIDDKLPEMKAYVDTFRNAGLKEIYVLANSTMMGVSPVRVVAVLEDGADPADLLAVVSEEYSFMFGGLHIEERENMLIFSPSPPQLDMTQPTAQARLKRMFDEIKAEPNPAIAAGLERVKGAPIQVVFVPDSSVRGMMSLGLAMAPPEAQKFGGKTLTDGVRAVSLGLDPVKQVFAITIQSTSEAAAKNLYDTTIAAIDENMANAMEQMPSGNPEEAEMVLKLVEELKAFIPAPRGNRLQLVVDRSFLEPRLATAGGMFIPAISAAREAARRMQCTNNIKQIMLAIHNYHDSQRGLPPHMTVDAAGKPLHSWRVLLLPYLEQTALYENIRLDEPWDSEHNSQFHDMAPRVYQCPSARGDMTGMTSYSVVVGDETVFHDADVKATFGAIADGLSNTIAVVERKTPVCWMDPTQEITFEKACEGINVSDDGIGSNHTRGMNVGMFDGSVQFFSETTPTEILKALLTCAGGEAFRSY